MRGDLKVLASTPEQNTFFTVSRHQTTQESGAQEHPMLCERRNRPVPVIHVRASPKDKVLASTLSLGEARTQANHGLADLDEHGK